jgi:two-component system chemotaxis response regulator CheY
MFDLSTRILVVDDMLTMRKLVGKVCKDIGFTDITEAADGNLAWQALNAASPPIGLIISDWNMPNCSGIDLLRKIRSDAKYGKLPFILVTAEAEQSQIIEAVKAGVSNYVVKPFTADVLKQKLEQVHTKLNAARG